MKVTVTRILRLAMVLVLLLLVFGWAQYTGEYGTKVSLRFEGDVRTPGRCQKLAQNLIQCQVPVGGQGQIQLQAMVTPARAVNIVAVSLPSGWPSFQVVSGWGRATAIYTFIPPSGSTGRRYELVFRAWSLSLYLDLKVILDVVARVTPTLPPTGPTGPMYGPFTGTTDASGQFSISITTLPNTSVNGRATQCGQRPLPGVPVTVTLVPKPGMTVIRNVGEIGAVRVSSPGYAEQVVTQLRLASSLDIWGKTHTTVDMGQVCLRPSLPPIAPTQPVIPTEPITGTTDEEGEISVPLPFPGTTVTGRLTECGKRSLPDQPFSITLVPKGEVIASPEDIGGFTVSLPGYEEQRVTSFSRISFFGQTSYAFGDVCLQPLPPPKLILVEVAERSFAPVYFQQQTVDELLRFRIEAPKGSCVERLVARLKPLPVSRVYQVEQNTHIALPVKWLGKDPEEVLETEGWTWELPVPFSGEFSTFDELEILRKDRVGNTPINEDTWFRVQEKELDKEKLKITPEDVAIGYWELEADIRIPCRTPNGKVYRIQSVPEEKEVVWITYRDGRKTRALVTVPHLYQVFSDKVDVYELESSYDTTLPPADPRQPVVQQNYSLVSETIEMRKEVTKTTIDLFAKVDLREWAPSPQLLLGGNYMVIGNPFDPADPGNAEIPTRSFHICPAIGDDDLAVESRSDVKIVPPFGNYEGEVTLEFGTWTKLAQDLLVEVIPMILTGGIPTTLSKFGEWGINKLVEIGRDKVTEALKEEEPTVMEAYAAVYQAVFSEMGDPKPYYPGLTALVPPKSKTEGWLGFEHKISCHWSSLGRPRYRMATGAAAAVIVMGEPDKIKNFLSSAAIKAGLSEQGLTSRWIIRDKSVAVGLDRGVHDPNPNSTWK